jgi:hypothetical protein
MQNNVKSASPTRGRVRDGRIWRIDVGMSFGVVGADPEVLEIDGDDVRVLTAKVPAAMSKL